MEHKIGDIVTLPNGRKAEVVEAPEIPARGCRCNGCIFGGDLEECEPYECSYYDRTDHKNIIYKKIKEE